MSARRRRCVLQAEAGGTKIVWSCTVEEEEDGEKLRLDRTTSILNSQFVTQVTTNRSIAQSVSQAADQS